MDSDRKQRLQYFLSIMDTMHDYADTSRISKVIDEKNSVRRTILNILGSLCNRAIRQEREVLRANSYDKMEDLRDTIYFTEGNLEAVLPSNFHERVIEIVEEVLGHFYDIQKLNIVLDENPGIALYKMCKDKYDTEHIMYVLDKNQADNDIFCLNCLPLKTIFQGKFYEYDNQRTNKKLTSANKISIDSYFKGGNKSCILNKDYFNYKITRSQNELFFLDELGVKKNGDEYDIYHKIDGEEYVILLEKFAKDSTKGLSLFLKAVYMLDDDKISIETFEEITVKTIASVFKIFCNKLPPPESSSTSRLVGLSRLHFMYALFDLKRAMDYLQVKACAAGNQKEENQKFVFVSQDRFSILYALINECPAIFTNQDKSLDLYMIDKKPLSGGLLTKPIKKLVNDNDEDILIHIKDILTDNILFKKVLRKYKQKSISILWYVMYQTLFYFLKRY